MADLSMNTIFLLCHSQTNVITGPIIVCNLYKIRINNLNREKKKNSCGLVYCIWEQLHTKCHAPIWKFFVFKALQSLFSSAEKAIFRSLTFQCSWGHNFSSRITKFRVHNPNTYIYPLQKINALSYSGRWQVQFEVRSNFLPSVHFFEFGANSFCVYSKYP